MNAAAQRKWGHMGVSAGALKRLKPATEVAGLGTWSPCPAPVSDVVGTCPFRRRPTATLRGSNGSGARWSAFAALPDFVSGMLSASAVVGYVAVGAAAILGRSVAEAARDTDRRNQH